MSTHWAKLCQLLLDRGLGLTEAGEVVISFATVKPEPELLEIFGIIAAVLLNVDEEMLHIRVGAVGGDEGASAQTLMYFLCVGSHISVHIQCCRSIHSGH